MTALWALITGSALGRAVAKIGALVLAVLTFGAYQRRSGAKDQKAKTDAAQAKETIKAHEVRNEVEDDVARGGNARDRLRSDWRE